MSINLNDLVNEQLTSGIVGKISSLIGENESATSSALKSFVPSILGSIVDKGSTKEGAGSLLDLINNNNLGGDTLSGLAGALGGGEKSNSFLNMGGSLLSAVLGGRQESMLSKLIGLTSLGKSGGGSLMRILAPIAFGVIGKVVRGEKLNAAGLMSLMTGQRSMLGGLIPSAVSGLLNFAGGKKEVHTEHSPKQVETKKEYVVEERKESNSGGGGGFLKFLLPLLLLVGLAWFLMRGCNKGETTTKDKQTIEKTTKDRTDARKATQTRTEGQSGTNTGTQTQGTTKATAGGASYRIDAKGNIIDANGKVVQPAGSYSKDANGNLVDASGNILVKAGQYAGKVAGAAGAAAGAAGNAASNAAAAVGGLSVNDAGDLVNAKGKVIAKKGEFSKDAEGNFVDKDGNKLGKLIKKIGEGIKKIGKKAGKGIKNAADKTGKGIKNAAGKVGDAVKGDGGN